MGTRSIHVRDAVSADVGLICDLVRALADYERLSAELQLDEAALREHLFGARPYVECLIGELDGNAVGYALYFHTYSTFLTKPGIWLEDLFVLPEQRRCGLGRAMLARLAAIAESRGCGRLEWSVLDWNNPAITFYRSIGAVPVEGWTQYRLRGPALAAFAASGRVGSR
jgi:GNAT superfamily N-acetyltransferase